MWNKNPKSDLVARLRKSVFSDFISLFLIIYDNGDTWVLGGGGVPRRSKPYK